MQMTAEKNTAAEEKFVAHVPLSALPALEKRLEKLQRKCAKYGNDDITFSYGEPYEVKLELRPGEGKVTVMFIDVTVEGDAPVYAGGWKLIARLEMMGGEENLVHRVPGSEDIALDDRYRTVENKCEHCNKIRSRNDIYVFQNEDGKEMVIGRTCLRDFLGIDDPKAIAQRAGLGDLFRDEIDEDRLMGDFTSSNFSAKELLEAGAAYIREFGFVSKARASQMGLSSTADLVKDYILVEHLMKKEDKPSGITAEDRKLAEEVFEHFTSRDQFHNEYLDNVRVVLQSAGTMHHTIKQEHAGLVVSAIASLNRDKVKKAQIAKVAEESTSVHVGTVGERMKGIEVLVEKEIPIDTMYGTSFLYILSDAAGNCYKWKASNKVMDVAKRYSIDAAVKEHGEFNGVKQTVLTRGKVKAEIA
jgi:hypothetical protein